MKGVDPGSVLTRAINRSAGPLKSGWRQDEPRRQRAKRSVTLVSHRRYRCIARFAHADDLADKMRATCNAPVISAPPKKETAGQRQTVEDVATLLTVTAELAWIQRPIVVSHGAMVGPNLSRSTI